MTARESNYDEEQAALAHLLRYLRDPHLANLVSQVVHVGGVNPNLPNAQREPSRARLLADLVRIASALLADARPEGRIADLLGGKVDLGPNGFVDLINEVSVLAFTVLERQKHRELARRAVAKAREAARGGAAPLWSPGRTAVHMLGLAATLLPASERHLYQQDWTGILYEKETRRARAAAVLSLLFIGAPRMAWEMRRPRRSDA